MQLTFMFIIQTYDLWDIDISYYVNYTHIYIYIQWHVHKFNSNVVVFSIGLSNVWDGWADDDSNNTVILSKSENEIPWRKYDVSIRKKQKFDSLFLIFISYLRHDISFFNFNKYDCNISNRLIYTLNDYWINIKLL